MMAAGALRRRRQNQSHPNRWLCKEAKFKAHALTTTRHAGGLDFWPMAEKTKARKCLQRYVCESKQSRGVRRTSCTPQRQSAAGGKRNPPQAENRTIYEAIQGKEREHGYHRG
jgi:hypothetical protein